jgi:hypothetical protein
MKQGPIPKSCDTRHSICTNRSYPICTLRCQSWSNLKGNSRTRRVTCSLSEAVADRIRPRFLRVGRVFISPSARAVLVQPNLLLLCVQLLSSVIMVLGRLVHYAVDAVLLSTVVAGVRRSSGYTSVPSFALSALPISRSHRARSQLTSFTSIDQMLLAYQTPPCAPSLRVSWESVKPCSM